MSPRLLTFLCLVTLAARADALTDPPSVDGTVLHCGADEVVIIGDSASGDGCLAAGWTIRPKDGQPAVDWSAYRREAPLAFIKKHGLNDNPGEDGDDPAKSPYRLVNGVVDLRARTFTALKFGSPYFPDKYRSSLEVTWSPEHHGTRYGVLANDVGSNHTDNNVDLQLVRFGPGGVRVTDLKPDADRAVQGFMKRRDPRDYRRYSWHFDPDFTFEGDALTIHFDAYVFLEPNNQDAGFVRFTLPKGTVVGTRADQKIKFDARGRPH